MNETPRQFSDRVQKAIANSQLQKALTNVERGFVAKRAKAVANLPEFEAIRDQAKVIKDHTLAHLDIYLKTYEKKVKASGGHVHWALDAAQAREIVLKICKQANAKTVTKGKSMVTEEIELNQHLEKNGIQAIETDLGEYIIQQRGETPSHIVAPAIHLNKEQVETQFRTHHADLPADRTLDTAQALLGEARTHLRQKYFQADVGITGANFLIAETGSSVIVTNEGNGDLTQSLAKTHIVVTSIEKIVPTLNDMSQLLRLLARSATGQEMSVYTTLSTGPKRANDPDGPENYHVVLLDNGRSDMLGSEFGDMLRCIRCGACMNHCPVYHAIGGHAYGSTYVGPMGAVLTPALKGVEDSRQLPNASTFCGRCEAVCPVRIPLPKMMRHWRQREFSHHLTPHRQRYALRLWAWVAQRPKLYHLSSRLAAIALNVLAFGRANLPWVPFASGWTTHRDLATPTRRTFMAQYKAQKRGRP